MEKRTSKAGCRRSRAAKIAFLHAVRRSSRLSLLLSMRRRIGNMLKEGEMLLERWWIVSLSMLYSFLVFRNAIVTSFVYQSNVLED